MQAARGALRARDLYTSAFAGQRHHVGRRRVSRVRQHSEHFDFFGGLMIFGELESESNWHF